MNMFTNVQIKSDLLTESLSNQCSVLFYTKPPRTKLLTYTYSMKITNTVVLIIMS